MFGMNVYLDGAEKFIDICHNEGVSEIRLQYPSDCSIKPVLEKVSAYNMKVYLSPIFDIHGHTLSSVRLHYEELFHECPSEIVSGVSLPEIMSLSSWPLKHSHYVNFVNDMSLCAKRNGHLTVMPVSLQELEAEEWCHTGIYAFDVSVVSSMDVERLGKAILNCPKNVWIGDITRAGGWLIPSHQVNTLNWLHRFKKFSRVERIYLRSSATPRFHWSIEGKFIVDLRNRCIKPDMTGKCYDRRMKAKEFNDIKAERRVERKANKKGPESRVRNGGRRGQEEV